MSVNNRLRSEYLEAMGVQPWSLRHAIADDAMPAAVAVDEDTHTGTDETGSPSIDTLDWVALEAQVAACTQCALSGTRTRTVFGTGNRQADWLIIGEAPGADEDRQGEPFVGRAGQLLNEMLYAAGYRRADVYIANILKCRPPGNRDPSGEEVACCHAYLQRQIALIKPKLIIAVGRIAAHNLLQTETQVGRLRGTVHYYGESRIPLIVTYHPAYLLRSPLEKRKVWNDLQLAQSVYRQQEVS